MSGSVSDLDPWHAVVTQAGLKGIGVYFSSGDSGDESTGTDDGKPSADFPASLDNAIAVGGTSLALHESGTRWWEHGWETAVSRLKPVVSDGGGADSGEESWQPPAPGEFVYGAGGGVSILYAQPEWQQLAVPSSLSSASGKPMRAVPDVAMLADPTTGFLFGQTNPKKKVYGESTIGGTSLACPLFSASVALAEQLAGAPIGFGNPLFYTAAWLGAFHDIVPPRHPIIAASTRGGAVVNYDFQGQTIRTTRGFDTVTGLGVPSGARFLETLGLLDQLTASQARASARLSK
jgi:subtilase family serine protease